MFTQSIASIVGLQEFLLFATHPDAASYFCGQFAEGVVSKVYFVLVRGHLASATQIVYPLAEEPHLPAYPASTTIEPLVTIEMAVSHGIHTTTRYTLCRVMPLQGRRHQIRKHLKHIFHPIVGDTCYGDGAHNRLFREHFGSRRLMLHASSLEIKRFEKQELISIKSNLPPDFIDVFSAMAVAVPEFC